MWMVYLVVVGVTELPWQPTPSKVKAEHGHRFGGM